jgi:hypothetical protein
MSFQRSAARVALWDTGRMEGELQIDHVMEFKPLK